MPRMTKLHICDENVFDRIRISYHEPSDTWWMEMSFDSCAISYCPFCGLELAKGTEMGWPCEEDVSDRNE